MKFLTLMLLWIEELSQTITRFVLINFLTFAMYSKVLVIKEINNVFLKDNVVPQTP